MPNRGSQNVRDNDYKWLVEVYGETCLICSRPPPPCGSLEIDEISLAEDHHYNPSDLSLVCGQCNIYLRGIDAADPRRPAQHRKIIEHYRALRVKARAREREKQGKSRYQVVTMPGVDEQVAREFERIIKKTGADIPLPDDSIKYILDYMHGSSEMKANIRFYKNFALYVWNRLLKNGPTPQKSLLNGGALRTHANQTTLKRYLDAWCADDELAPLQAVDSGGEWQVFFRDPVKAKQISDLIKQNKPEEKKP